MPVTTLAPTVKSVPQAASGDSSRNGESGSTQQVDALPDGEPAPGAVPGHVGLAAAGSCHGQLVVEQLEHPQVVGAVRDEFV